MFGIFKSYKRLFGKGAAESFNRMAAYLTNFCTNESLNFDRPDNPGPDNPPCMSINTDWLKSYADGKYVTLDTDQTITGQKTIDNKHFIINSTGQYSTSFIVRNGATNALSTRKTQIVRGGIYLDNTSDSSAATLEFRHLVNGEGQKKAQLYITSTGILKLCAKGSSDDWAANAVQLQVSPSASTSTSSTAVATTGWCNTYFWQKNTSSTGFIFNTNGTLSHKSFGTAAGTVAEGDHTHTVSSITDLNLSGYLQTSAVGTATTVGYLKLLVAQLSSTGKVPLSMLTGNIAGHQHDCLVTIDNGGNLGHSGNAAYNAVTSLASDYTAWNSDCLPYLQTRTNQQGQIIGIYLPTSSSSATELIPLLTASPSSDKVLTVKAGASVLTWEDGGSSAQNPSTAVTSLANAAPGTATANSGTWTAGGSNGVVVRVQTRTMWNGTNLYGFYRDLTFDKHGRLYSSSVETSFTIDTPVKVTWS